MSKGRGDQISGGIFLIGLGILFFTHIGFWPGILFVIGAAAIARGVAEGQTWYNVPGGLWMIGLGLLFLFNFNWPVLLILIGVSMLFGYNYRSSRKHDDIWEKPKNEDKRKNDDPHPGVI